MQDEQAVAPDDAEYVPEAQIKHNDDPAFELKVPAAQLEHDVAPGNEISPEAHDEQFIPPVLACDKEISE